MAAFDYRQAEEIRDVFSKQSLPRLRSFREYWIQKGRPK
jgi:hypothetical protein